MAESVSSHPVVKMKGFVQARWTTIGPPLFVLRYSCWSAVVIVYQLAALVVMWLTGVSCEDY